MVEKTAYKTLGLLSLSDKVFLHFFTVFCQNFCHFIFCILFCKSVKYSSNRVGLESDRHRLGVGFTTSWLWEFRQAALPDLRCCLQNAHNMASSFPQRRDPKEMEERVPLMTYIRVTPRHCSVTLFLRVRSPIQPTVKGWRIRFCFFKGGIAKNMWTHLKPPQKSNHIVIQTQTFLRVKGGVINNQGWTVV